MGDSISYQFKPPFSETEVILRTLEKKDLSGLEWEGEYIHFRNLYRDMWERIKKGREIGWVAVDLKDGIFLGQVFIQYGNTYRPDLADGINQAYLHGFRIREQYRNAGLGSFMLSWVEKKLVSMGFKTLCLAVAKDNLGAIRLYERLGFIIVGEEEGVWSYMDHKGRYRRMVEPSWRMVNQFIIE
ncbi:MAG: GNAT family N-acetyltransferase [Anaerolineales bacterium]|nr:GNAT family N-acetyltransferase [Anaerolineales bacterium]